jgi:predicted NUDIX family NTP pyrophosphohydrolase
VNERRLLVLLVHPGGPFFARKDTGAWTIPKGEPEDGERLVDTARREWVEETGWPVPNGELMALGSVRQRGGKVVHCWAIEGSADPQTLVSQSFELEWPPRSGRSASFPEVDRAAWFDQLEAAERINSAQVAFIERLAEHLDLG